MRLDIRKLSLYILYRFDPHFIKLSRNYYLARNGLQVGLLTIDRDLFYEMTFFYGSEATQCECRMIWSRLYRNYGIYFAKIMCKIMLTFEYTIYSHHLTCWNIWQLDPINNYCPVCVQYCTKFYHFNLLTKLFFCFFCCR